MLQSLSTGGEPMRTILLPGLLAFLIGCGEPAEFDSLSAPGERSAYTSSRIQPFTSDGCSLFPDGDWVHCCVVHDLRYWMGGLESDKHAADLRLWSCVDEVAVDSWIDIGWWMYQAVDVVGSPAWGPVEPKQTEPWRWGYGWPDRESAYSVLTPDQIVSIEEELLRVQDSLQWSGTYSGPPLTPEQQQAVLQAIAAYLAQP
jgi:hypothetical protein